MGMKGIRVKRKITPGNRARKKEKLMDAARLVTEPSYKPCQ
jgi:hypothetical protein